MLSTLNEVLTQGGAAVQQAGGTYRIDFPTSDESHGANHRTQGQLQIRGRQAIILHVNDAVKRVNHRVEGASASPRTLKLRQQSP